LKTDSATLLWDTLHILRNHIDAIFYSAVT